MVSSDFPTGFSALDPHEPLTCEHLYRRDTRPYEHEAYRDWRPDDDVLDKARGGDEQARHTLLLQMQGYVQYWAYRFARAYSWASPRIDFMELVSEGNLVMWTRMDRCLCERDNPTAALKATAKYAMWKHCRLHASPITIPDDSRSHFPYYPTRSLNAPLTKHTDSTLEQFIPDRPLLLISDETQDAQAHTHEEVLISAVHLLTERQQAIITRKYGLGDQEPEQVDRIAQDVAEQPISRQSVHKTHDRAIEQLRLLLSTPEGLARIQQEQCHPSPARKQARTHAPLDLEERKRKIADQKERRRSANARYWAKAHPRQQEASA